MVKRTPQWRCVIVDIITSLELLLPRDWSSLRPHENTLAHRPMLAILSPMLLKAQFIRQNMAGIIVPSYKSGAEPRLTDHKKSNISRSSQKRQYNPWRDWKSTLDTSHYAYTSTTLQSPSVTSIMAYQICLRGAAATRKTSGEPCTHGAGPL